MWFVFFFVFSSETWLIRFTSSAIPCRWPPCSRRCWFSSRSSTFPKTICVGGRVSFNPASGPEALFRKAHVNPRAISVDLNPLAGSPRIRYFPAEIIRQALILARIPGAKRARNVPSWRVVQDERISFGRPNRFNGTGHTRDCGRAAQITLFTL